MSANEKVYRDDEVNVMRSFKNSIQLGRMRTTCNWVVYEQHVIRSFTNNM